MANFKPLKLTVSEKICFFFQFRVVIFAQDFKFMQWDVSDAISFRITTSLEILCTKILLNDIERKFRNQTLSFDPENLREQETGPKSKNNSKIYLRAGGGGRLILNRGLKSSIQDYFFFHFLNPSSKSLPIPSAKPLSKSRATMAKSLFGGSKSAFSWHKRSWSSVCSTSFTHR